jgi:hypothetical protein
MNSCRIVTQQVVAELIGKKNYRPLITVPMEELDLTEGGASLVVHDFDLCPKSLQIISTGAYTLRFVVDGRTQEYVVNVLDKKLLPVEDEIQKAA